MKQRFLFALFLSLIVLPFVVVAGDVEIPRMNDGRILTGRVAELELSHPDQLLHTIAGTFAATTIEHGYDQVFLDLDLHPNFIDSVITARAKFVVKSTSSPLSILSFHYYSEFEIDSILFDGSQVSFSRSDDPVLLNVEPDLATNCMVDVDLSSFNIQSGDMVELMIYYKSQVLGLVNTGLTYQWGTSVRPEANVLYSYNEPNMARLWFPSYDHPGDKFDSTRIAITLPSGFSVLSNGLLESEVTEVVDEEELKTTTWFNPDPISTYLISIAAKQDYVIVDGGVGGEANIPVKYWLYDEWYSTEPSSYTLEGATYDLARTPQMINLYEEKFGAYPFNKYDQAISPILGAMEHQTATTLGEFYVGAGERTGEMTVAHELSHQWWGDCVGPASFKDIWLNEGFATYCEEIWVEEVYPISASAYMATMQSNAKDFDTYTDYPLSDPAYPYIVSLVYDKGGAVLHMLRLVVGEEDFFNGLKSYLVAHAYGSATTAEFQAAMEAESGMDLTTFFDQWVHGQGWPEFNLVHYWSEEVGDGLYDSYLIVDQVQESDQFFATSMPIRLRSLQDRSEDSVYVAHIDAAERDTVYLGRHSWQTRYIGFNFKNWVLCEFNANNLTGVETPSVAELPSRYEISPSWPNPFNAATSFDLMLPTAGEVSVDVVNMLGRRVASLSSGPMSAGRHKMSWQPQSNLASGIYLIRVRADGSQMVRRVTLVR